MLIGSVVVYLLLTIAIVGMVAGSLASHAPHAVHDRATGRPRA